MSFLDFYGCPHTTGQIMSSDKYSILHRTPPASDPASPRPDLSVVVPVSNIAPYIQPCLDSLTAQGALDIEFILIDYNSTDGGREKLLHFANSHPHMRIVVVEQIRKGLGNARNFGVEIATGEFISFIDGDDVLCPDIYERMVYMGRQHKLDLIICRSAVFDHNTKVTSLSHVEWVWQQILKNNRCVITNARREPRVLQLELGASTRMLHLDFMREQQIYCPEDVSYEDMVPHLKGCLAARRIGLLADYIYFYRIGRVGRQSVNKGDWWFGLLDEMDSALAAVMPFSPDERIGAAIVLVFAFAIIGGEYNTHHHNRRQFYVELAKRFQRLPQSWIDCAEREFHVDMRMIMVISALRHQNYSLLINFGARKPSGWRMASHFLRRGYGIYAWQKRYRLWQNTRAWNPPAISNSSIKNVVKEEKEKQCTD